MASGSTEALAAQLSSHTPAINPKLINLICTIISARIDVWRDAAIQSRISMPKLKEFDWSLHFQRAASQVNKSIKVIKKIL